MQCWQWRTVLHQVKLHPHVMPGSVSATSPRFKLIDTSTPPWHNWLSIVSPCTPCQWHVTRCHMLEMISSAKLVMWLDGWINSKQQENTTHIYKGMLKSAQNATSYKTMRYQPHLVNHCNCALCPLRILVSADSLIPILNISISIQQRLCYTVYRIQHTSISRFADTNTQHTSIQYSR